MLTLETFIPQCDERHPICGNCTRRDIAVDCVYTRTLQVVLDENDSLGEENLAITLVRSPSSSNHASFSGISIPASNDSCLCGHAHPYPTRLTSLSTEFPGGLPACSLIYAVPASSSSEAAPDLHPRLVTSANQSTIKFSNNLSLNDLSLLHHFVSFTSGTMTTSSSHDIRTIWSEVVPRLSRSYPFLMQAVLGAASAHIGTNESRLMATHHIEQALKGLQHELSGNTNKKINDENCHALFVTLSIINLYSLSPRRYECQIHETSPTGTAGVTSSRRLDTSWTIFTRGAFGILQKSWRWIIDGPISPLFRPYPSTFPAPTLSERTEVMFSDLFKLCSDSSINGGSEELGDIQSATAYFVALWNLKRVWGILEDCCPSGQIDDYAEIQIPDRGDLYIAIFQFILRTPADFWKHLEIRKPRALVIYAYYVICWEALTFGSRFNHEPAPQPNSNDQGCSATWWTSGRAELDLKGVEEELRVQGILEPWKAWMDGAWRVLYGLREGWWFEINEDSNHSVDVGQFPVAPEFNINMEQPIFRHGAEYQQSPHRLEPLRPLASDAEFSVFLEYPWIMDLFENASLDSSSLAFNIGHNADQY